jgi:hypothetical protein
MHKAAVLALVLSPVVFGQQLKREEWGAPAIIVSHSGGKWTIAGKRNTVTINQADLTLKVQAGTVNWEMVSSAARDMLVRSKGEDFFLRLADAKKMEIAPYDTGFKTGIKISLGGW